MIVYDILIAVLLVFFALMLFYALFVNAPRPEDLRTQLRSWKNSDAEGIYYTIQQRMGSSVLTVYYYSLDYMIRHVIDRDNWYYTIHGIKEMH